MQERRFRNSITLFTFALTILVIWVHSVNLTEAGFAATGLAAVLSPEGAWLLPARFAEVLLSEIWGGAAVPGFFIMSAYLFFRSAPAPEAMSFGWFAGKWKKRVFSLLVPYLLWNLIYYALHLLAAYALPLSETLFAEGGELGYSLLPQSAGDLLGWRAFLEAAFFYRYNPVFWYLYELIILVALTPVIWFLLHHKRPAPLILAASFLAAVFWERLPFHIVNEDALFYYMLGSYAALHGKKIAERTDTGLRKSFLICSGLLLVWLAAFSGALSADTGPASASAAELSFSSLISSLSFLSGKCRSFWEGRGLGAQYVIAGTVLWRALAPVWLFLLLRLVGIIHSRFRAFLERERLPQVFSVSFLIYAAHYLLVRGVYKLLAAGLGFFADRVAASGGGTITLAGDGGQTAVSAVSQAAVLSGNAAAVFLLAVYLLLPVFCVALCCAVSTFFQRYAPWAGKLLTGGRG